MTVYTMNAANNTFENDDEVMLTYNVFMSELDEKVKIFAKFHLEWEAEECLDVDKDGECTEVAGTLIGTYRDAFAFLLEAHPGDEFKKLDSYITKI